MARNRLHMFVPESQNCTCTGIYVSSQDLPWLWRTGLQLNWTVLSVKQVCMWAFMRIKFMWSCVSFQTSLYCEILQHMFNMTSQQPWVQLKLVKYLCSCTVETRGILDLIGRARNYFVFGKAEDKWNLEHFCCSGKCEGTGGWESCHDSLVISYPNCKKNFFPQVTECSSVCPNGTCYKPYHFLKWLFSFNGITNKRNLSAA